MEMHELLTLTWRSKFYKKTMRPGEIQTRRLKFNDLNDFLFLDTFLYSIFFHQNSSVNLGMDNLIINEFF